MVDCKLSIKSPYTDRLLVSHVGLSSQAANKRITARSDTDMGRNYCVQHLESVKHDSTVSKVIRTANVDARLHAFICVVQCHAASCNI